MIALATTARNPIPSGSFYCNLKLIAFALCGVIVMLGIIADRIKY